MGFLGVLKDDLCVLKGFDQFHPRAVKNDDPLDGKETVLLLATRIESKVLSASAIWMGR